MHFPVVPFWKLPWDVLNALRRRHHQFTFPLKPEITEDRQPDRRRQQSEELFYHNAGLNIKTCLRMKSIRHIYCWGRLKCGRAAELCPTKLNEAFKWLTDESAKLLYDVHEKSSRRRRLKEASLQPQCTRSKTWEIMLLQLYINRPYRANLLHFEGLGHFKCV